jgi:hypothetical protein
LFGLVLWLRMVKRRLFVLVLVLSLKEGVKLGYYNPCVKMDILE